MQNFVNVVSGKKRKDQHDAAHLGTRQNSSFAAPYGTAPPVSTSSISKNSSPFFFLCSSCFLYINQRFIILQLSQIPYPGGPVLPEAPAPPNSILFVQNLPHDATPMMLQMLFLQYDGFKEVRMVEAKPGIAFVEYGNEVQSTLAMQALQGFKVQQNNPMLITYAKK